MVKFLKILMVSWKWLRKRLEVFNDRKDTYEDDEAVDNHEGGNFVEVRSGEVMRCLMKWGVLQVLVV